LRCRSVIGPNGKSKSYNAIMKVAKYFFM
jgi:hypothetical protein